MSADTWEENAERRRTAGRRGGLAKAANRRAAADYAGKHPDKAIGDEEWRESWKNALSRGKPLPRTMDPVAQEPTAPSEPSEWPGEAASDPIAAVHRAVSESHIVPSVPAHHLIPLIPASALVREQVMLQPGETRDQFRSRRKHSARAKTISVKRMPKRELEFGRRLYEAMGGDDLPRRPATRGECVGHEGPCPFVSCKHHLYLDVDRAENTGAIKLNFPDLDLWEMTETCALDVADRGGQALEEVGAIMNLTRERIRQIEVKALRKATPWAHSIMADVGPDPTPSEDGRRLPGGAGGEVDADVHEHFFGEHYGDSVPDRRVDP